MGFISERELHSIIVDVPSDLKPSDLTKYRDYIKKDILNDCIANPRKYLGEWNEIYKNDICFFELSYVYWSHIHSWSLQNTLVDSIVFSIVAYKHNHIDIYIWRKDIHGKEKRR